MKLLMFALLCSGVVGLQAQESTPLKLIQTIRLPGVKGRFDHFAIDAKGQRLFIAALGNNTLEVLDLAQGRRLKSVPGLSKPTGVVFLPDGNNIGVANGEEGTFRLLDGTSYGVVKNLGSLADADNVRLDGEANLLYIGYGDGALGITDLAATKLIASIHLPAHPESFQIERQGQRLFVNLPEAKRIAVVDRAGRRVLTHWPMEKFQANFPMALDEAAHRLFVGCRTPARLVVFDTEKGALVTDLEISGDTDDLFHDRKRNRLYLSCGEGFLDTIEQGAADRWERIARQATRAGARTCFFSSETDRLYLAVPQRDGHEAEVRVYQPTTISPSK